MLQHGSVTLTELNELGVRVTEDPSLRPVLLDALLEAFPDDLDDAIAYAERSQRDAIRLHANRKVRFAVVWWPFSDSRGGRGGHGGSGPVLGTFAMALYRPQPGVSPEIGLRVRSHLLPSLLDSVVDDPSEFEQLMTFVHDPAVVVYVTDPERYNAAGRRRSQQRRK